MRIGIDFDKTTTTLGLFNPSMTPIDHIRVRIPADSDPASCIQQLGLAVEKLLTRNKLDSQTLRGVGISFPGQIALREGTVLHSDSFPALQGCAPAMLLQQLLHVPTMIDSQIHCTALAEHCYGAGRGLTHSVYLSVDNTIDCGIVLGDKLYHGVHGAACMVGNFFLSDTYGYTDPREKAGTLQSIVTPIKLSRLARESIQMGSSSSILTHAGSLHAIDCEHIGMALEDKDALAIQIINYAATYLARMLANLYELLDIPTVICGGTVMKFGATLFNGIMQEFLSASQSAYKDKFELKKPLLQDHSALLGAGLIVTQ